ncbi:MULTISPECIES: MBL fold metallo-hydrolase [Veillonella]|jgi:metallo-beta-lactamase domain protein|uniref:MBL fold hydrolase n=1 Tax=Veillonella tobetsuensis TaxID=1110546 RepID=A0A480B2J5_9FIRM|nr:MULTISPECIES: MBL fold metallo-hydrolase [Veillonella]MBF1756361.1 MBL fold metallo-hydrolase [Veillonella tobetsuensis]MDU5083982.1 MBL fold metallo-hydrolase [Veillonella sp.]GCL66718.1 MBL fold hydrolase [Veillonella tobetsuensis]GCL68259.1 MBL fold hydrolase [Veillonella tobetsuensis]
MEIIKRPLGLYKANCYVLKQDNLSLIIDPGFHSRHIIDMVGDTTPLAVVLTHGHCDHVSALDEICEHYKIPAYLHKGDHELLQLIRRRPSVYKKKMFTQCISLHEGSLEIGPFKFYVYHTPGHSAGSVCLQIENHLFTGDTIFKQNVGNSDNYNGNADDLRKSLDKILQLDDALLVEPGHKDSTILGDEKNFIMNFNI